VKKRSKKFSPRRKNSTEASPQRAPSFENPERKNEKRKKKEAIETPPKAELIVFPHLESITKKAFTLPKKKRGKGGRKKGLDSPGITKPLPPSGYFEVGPGGPLKKGQGRQPLTRAVIKLPEGENKTGKK